MDGSHIILGSTGDPDHLGLAVTVVDVNAREINSGIEGYKQGEVPLVAGTAPALAPPASNLLARLRKP